MKSYQELQISKEEYDALLLVREGLAAGKWKHSVRPSDEEEDFGCAFNMGYAAVTASCGTVACIGGWMGIAMGKTMPETNAYVGVHEPYRRGSQRPIANLFYPDTDQYMYEYKKITDAEAVIAIDNFLETGNPDWRSILGRR